jgi:hypothetical protein
VRLDEYVPVLAGDEYLDIDLLENAYSAAKIAVDALLAGAPADQVRDTQMPNIEPAIEELRAMGQIKVFYDEDSKKLTMPLAPGPWPPKS